jgi:hypothetical protein
MEKKTCRDCGKTWLLEKFNQHHCTLILAEKRIVNPPVSAAARQSNRKERGPEGFATIVAAHNRAACHHSANAANDFHSTQRYLESWILITARY